jgi:hypothetical protein
MSFAGMFVLSNAKREEVREKAKKHWRTTVIAGLRDRKKSGSPAEDQRTKDTFKRGLLRTHLLEIRGFYYAQKLKKDINLKL